MKKLTLEQIQKRVEKILSESGNLLTEKKNTVVIKVAGKNTEVEVDRSKCPKVKTVEFNWTKTGISSAHRGATYTIQQQNNPFGDVGDVLGWFGNMTDAGVRQWEKKEAYGISDWTNGKAAKLADQKMATRKAQKIADRKCMQKIQTDEEEWQKGLEGATFFGKSYGDKDTPGDSKEIYEDTRIEYLKAAMGIQNMKKFNSGRCKKMRVAQKEASRVRKYLKEKNEYFQSDEGESYRNRYTSFTNAYKKYALEMKIFFRNTIIPDMKHCTKLKKDAEKPKPVPGPAPKPAPKPEPKPGPGTKRMPDKLWEEAIKPGSQVPGEQCTSWLNQKSVKPKFKKPRLGHGNSDVHRIMKSKCEADNLIYKFKMTPVKAFRPGPSRRRQETNITARKDQIKGWMEREEPLIHHPLTDRLKILDEVYEELIARGIAAEEAPASGAWTKKVASAMKPASKPAASVGPERMPDKLWEAEPKAGQISLTDRTAKQAKRHVLKMIRSFKRDARNQKWSILKVNEIAAKMENMINGNSPGMKALKSEQGSRAINYLLKVLSRAQKWAWRGDEKGWPRGYGRSSGSSRTKTSKKYGEPGWRPDKIKSKAGDAQFEQFYADLEKAKLLDKLGRRKKDYNYGRKHKSAYKALLAWAKENNVKLGEKPDDKGKDTTTPKPEKKFMWCGSPDVTEKMFALWNQNRKRMGLDPLRPGDCQERGITVIRTGAYLGLSYKEMQEIITGNPIAQDLDRRMPAIDVEERERQTLEVSEDSERLYALHDDFTDEDEEKQIEKIVRKHLNNKTIGYLDNIYARKHAEKEPDSPMTLRQMLQHEGSGAGGSEALRKLAQEVEVALSRPTRGARFRKP